MYSKLYYKCMIDCDSAAGWIAPTIAAFCPSRSWRGLRVKRTTPQNR